MKNKLMSIILTLVLGAIVYYVTLPVINVTSLGFWFFIVFLLIIFAVADMIFNTKGMVVKNTKLGNYALCIIPVIVIGIVAIDVLKSPVFDASGYAKRIEIDEAAEFFDKIEPVNFNHLPLLDKDSSNKLGDRVMGQMPELVSQFFVSEIYTQINFNNEIVRVTPLEYDGLIKYFTNRQEGIKGYITVNSVDGEAKLTKLDKGMHYMPSAMFNEDLYRHVRFKYPFDELGDANFELDNDGNPFWTIPTIKYSGIGLRRDISGLILVDPISGDTIKYRSEEVPAWIDHVYPSELIIEQVDNWGQYRGGFINSIFGQKNVVVTSEGYNYTVIGDDVYLFTGVTSASSDESNLGFIVSNLRTKETNFYAVPGAQEVSAMASAQGQVQQMNYVASFPLLINLNDRATYLISLKDNAGLVKMYAFVDVADYQKVVVSDSSAGIEAAAANYLGNKVSDIDKSKIIEITPTFTKHTSIVIDGNTYYYLIDSEGNNYRAQMQINDIVLAFLEDNMAYKVTYYEENNVRIIQTIE